MSRFPIIAGDINSWGSILNDCLSVSLNDDGTLKTSSSAVTAVNVKGPPYNASGDGVTDDSSAIQAAITAAKDSLTGRIVLICPSGTYKLNTALDFTHIQSVTLLGAGPMKGDIPPNSATEGVTTFLGNTGSVVMDLTGSGKIHLRNFQIRVLNSYSNPSKVGILMARSNTVQSAQGDWFEDVRIYMESAPAATARGRIGIYNVCAEHALYDAVDIIADTPVVLATTDIMSVPSPYQGALFASTMTVNQFRMCTFVARVNNQPVQMWGGGQITFDDCLWSSLISSTGSAFAFNSPSQFQIYASGEIENLAYVIQQGSGVDLDSLTLSLNIAGASAPYFQFGVGGLSLAHSHIRIRQSSGTPQLVFQNSSYTVKDSIVYLGTSSGVNGIALNSSILLADAGSTTLTPAAGSDYLLLSSPGIRLEPGSGDIRWGKALVALGGGAAPTLGTIGGSGPATAAQNSWMRVLDSTGAAFWIPVWK